jgi:hypothetical protein
VVEIDLRAGAEAVEKETGVTWRIVPYTLLLSILGDTNLYVLTMIAGTGRHNKCESEGRVTCNKMMDCTDSDCMITRLDPVACYLLAAENLARRVHNPEEAHVPGNLPQELKASS